MELGANIHTLRTDQGLTLEALAEKSGVSRAMLSDVERGAKSPTVRIVAQIAQALDCTVSHLLGEPPPVPHQPAVQVVRRKERAVTVEPRTDVERHQLAPSFVRRGVEVLMYSIPGNSRTSLPVQPQGTEAHLTVTRGDLVCKLGTQEMKLADGDSVQFDADVEQTFINNEKKPCRFFMVVDAARPSQRR
jgi:transcriptional regulator with XRE-family HTH domain